MFRNSSDIDREGKLLMTYKSYILKNISIDPGRIMNTNVYNVTCILGCLFTDQWKTKANDKWNHVAKIENE